VIIKSKVILFWAIALFLLVSHCQKHSSGPDEIVLDESQSNLTEKNLQKISDIHPGEPDKFSFAVIADSHTDYTDLGDVLNDIDQKAENLFVIHVGDFTDAGWLGEYRGTYQAMSGLTIPYLTVIGNHDELTRGREIYRKMFGDFNYSFVFGNCKFVMLECNSTAYFGVPPDLNWLEDQLEDDSLYNLVFVVGHQPPFDPGWNDQYENRYRQLMQENGVALSIHGHTHDFEYGEKYDDGMKYLVVNDVGKRSYCNISVDSVTFDMEKVDLNP
jgi:3',5'-cyclic-AMP phosphodiesterase